MKIGIIKEEKVPSDRRVPFLPEQCIEIKNQSDEFQVIVKSSDIRCVSDSNYANAGIPVKNDVTDCDTLFGVKEVPIDSLIPEKTYFFFSHTAKMQPYNRDLLSAIIEKNIRLIDYEYLTDKKGKRIVAFGRFAGIVGAYNGIWTYGKRFNQFDLKRAYQCENLEELKGEFSKVKLPPVKIIITGGGRVSSGAEEVLQGMKIRKVAPDEFLNNSFSEPVYVQLNADDYHEMKDGSTDWVKSDFYKYPEKFKSAFRPFTEQADILIAGSYWDPKAPKLFKREDMQSAAFKLKVIADITCDIDGSIPSTLRPSTIEDPLYDYNPTTGSEELPLSGENNITVMAVDNLPCELPYDASESFGEQLLKGVIPALIDGDQDQILDRATITCNGNLTPRFDYLRNYLEGKSVH